MKMPFRWVEEELPGPRWQDLFTRTCPAYRAWFLAEGDERRPSLEDSRAALERYMPELLPVWRRLVELAGGGEDVARMLCLHRPTPYLAGCSQAVWTRGELALVRNYDYHPGACEGLFLSSRWSGTRVLAASDCLWGALDGMNEHGLVLALAFGGRRVVGDGFGIPLVLRYALETCRTTPEALEVLCRIPSHMAYNVLVLDAGGEHALVVLSPDAGPRVERVAVATNHQPARDWSEYDRWTRSGEREEFLKAMLSDPGLDLEAFKALFLQPPLFANRYERGFGTLYTAAYLPASRELEVSWRGARVRQRLDAFEERTLVIPLEAAPRPA